MYCAILAVLIQIAKALLQNNFFAVYASWFQFVFRGTLGLRERYWKVLKAYFMYHKHSKCNFMNILSSFIFFSLSVHNRSHGLIRCKSPKLNLCFPKMPSNILFVWLKTNVLSFFFIFHKAPYSYLYRTLRKFRCNHKGSRNGKG